MQPIFDDQLKPFYRWIAGWFAGWPGVASGAGATSPPPPMVIAVAGPPEVGKSTLIRSLIKHWTRRNVPKPRGPLTVVSGKRARVTLLEVCKCAARAPSREMGVMIARNENERDLHRGNSLSSPHLASHHYLESEDIETGCGESMNYEQQ